jgi:hypothetical protein
MKGSILKFIASIGIMLAGVITVEPENPQQHRRIAATIEQPTLGEGSSVDYEWTHSPLVDLEVMPEGSGVRIWAPPGTHWLKCRTMVIDWEKKEFNTLDEETTFIVGLAPSPTPTPIPTPTPTPTPPPAPDTLCDLVTPEVAEQLRGIYLSQVVVLQRTEETTTVAFLIAHDTQLRNHGLSDNGAARVIAKRIQTTIGEATAISGEAKGKLIGTLNQIAKELECKPVPPIPSEGSRVVVIVRESKAPPQWLISLINDLRDGDGADYLDEKEHQLFVLDPDDKDADGNPHPILAFLNGQTQALPAIYVIDDLKENILSAGPLPHDTAGVLDIIKKDGG